MSIIFQLIELIVDIGFVCLPYVLIAHVCVMIWYIKKTKRLNREAIRVNRNLQETSFTLNGQLIEYYRLAEMLKSNVQLLRELRNQHKADKNV